MSSYVKAIRKMLAPTGGHPLDFGDSCRLADRLGLNFVVFNGRVHYRTTGAKWELTPLTLDDLKINAGL